MRAFFSFLFNIVLPVGVVVALGFGWRVYQDKQNVAASQAALAAVEGNSVSYMAQYVESNIRKPQFDAEGKVYFAVVINNTGRKTVRVSYDVELYGGQNKGTKRTITLGPVSGGQTAEFREQVDQLNPMFGGSYSYNARMLRVDF